MRSSLKLWILFGLIVPLSVTTSAYAQSRCDFADEANELVRNSPALTAASRALRALKDVQDYPVGGDFFPDRGPDGQPGEVFKREVLKQFQNADSDFRSILIGVIIARKPNCELCELKHHYRRAEDLGFPLVTKDQLRKYKSLFSKLVRYKDSLEDYRNERRSRGEGGGRTNTVDDAIEDTQKLLTEGSRFFRSESDYDRTSRTPEAANFARDMASTDSNVCKFLERDGERRRREEMFERYSREPVTDR
jgi:hypothetical protein